MELIAFLYILSRTLLIVFFNSDYALEIVMKGQYAKIASAHARFYDDEIVNTILKNKIE